VNDSRSSSFHVGSMTPPTLPLSGTLLYACLIGVFKKHKILLFFLRILIFWGVNPQTKKVDFERFVTFGRKLGFTDAQLTEMVVEGIREILKK